VKPCTCAFKITISASRLNERIVFYEPERVFMKACRQCGSIGVINRERIYGAIIAAGWAKKKNRESTRFFEVIC
jgi:hypothetical protein